MPVAIAIAIGALVFFLDQTGLPLSIFAQRMLTSSDSFPLVAIPMFTLAGVIMNHSGITARLLNLAECLVGHLPGALAQTNVVLATLMGFESGIGQRRRRDAGEAARHQTWSSAATIPPSPRRSSPPRR